MSNGVARVGDTISGTCTGIYERYETVGHDSDGHPIRRWVQYEESGTVTGIITSGSPDTFIDGLAVARVGDTVSITKTYPHSNHIDDLEVTGVISSGSDAMLVNGKKVACVGSKINASNVTATIERGSSTVFV